VDGKDARKPKDDSHSETAAPPDEFGGAVGFMALG
jgi:hypothetical protein